MDILNSVKKSMSEHRFQHTLGVVQTSIELANQYGVNTEDARIAALLHDVARDQTDQKLLEMANLYKIEVSDLDVKVPQLLHGKVGAEISYEQFKINNVEVLDAIRYHTTGRKNMTQLEKVIFLADMIEPGRDYPGVDALRATAVQNLDCGVLQGLDSTIRHVIEQGMLIHPEGVEARNWLLLVLKEKF